MFSDPSLGTLSRLPPEIRLQIWSHFSLKQTPYGPADLVPLTSIEPRLALLLASRRIYDEVTEHLYKNVTLRFQIDPSYQHRSWLTVKSNIGISWHLQNVDDAVSRGFGALPYEKPKAIRINITAPDGRDPGQIVCLWKKCLDLGELLGKSFGGRRNIEILLENRKDLQWFQDGLPQMSVSATRNRCKCSPQDGQIDRPDKTFIQKDDIRIVLTAFQHLRNIKEIKICPPQDKRRSFKDYTNHLENLLMQKEVFRTLVGPPNSRNEPIFQQKRDDLSMNLDRELDFLPGETAEIMRSDRFGSWYSNGLGRKPSYEDELEKSLKARDPEYYSKSIQLVLRYEPMLKLLQRAMKSHTGAAKECFETYPGSLSPDDALLQILNALNSRLIEEGCGVTHRLLD